VRLAVEVDILTIQQRVGGWDVDFLGWVLFLFEKYMTVNWLLFPFIVIIVCWWMVEAIVKNIQSPFLC